LLLQGCIISSAVIPATLALMWKDQNWQAAAAAPVLGFACALIAWLVTAKRECGVLNVDCTGSNNPMLAGNVTALLSPIIFVPIFTYAFGRQNYDWVSMREIRKGDDSEIIRRASVDTEIQREIAARTAEQEAAEQTKLNKAAIISRSLTGFMTIALLVLWPMPLYGTGYIFSKKFFTGTSTRYFSCQYRASVSSLSLLIFRFVLSRLGRGRHPLALLQHLRRRTVPALAGPQDHGPYRQVDLLGRDGQETPGHPWTRGRDRGGKR
jgi:hypothetical protein